MNGPDDESSTAGISGLAREQDDLRPPENPGAKAQPGTVGRAAAQHPEVKGRWTQATSAAVRRVSGRRPVLLALAALTTAASLFAVLGAGGIWDPYELGVAELSRRIAVAVFGADGLALHDALNTVPTLGEIGRGELPFTSIAVGFRLFGLSAWAGRLPLAVWGLVGVVALFVLLARLVDRAAAAFGALALSTMPLYFAQARTILGDIVLMSALALAVSGLALAAFDGSPARPAKKLWVLWVVTGLAGLVAGFMTRGILIGVAVPALAVGAAWGLSRTTGAGPNDRLRDIAGAASALIGLAALGAGAWALKTALGPNAGYSVLLGTAAHSEPLPSTHDVVIHQLGHALFPWSALVPLAVGGLLRSPPGNSGGGSERALRAVLLMTVAFAFVSQTLLAPYLGALPFSAVFALAASAGVFLRDMERGARTSPVQAVVSVAVAVLLFLDYQRLPEAMLSAFCVEDAALPSSFQPTGSRLLLASTSLVAIVTLFSLMDSESRPRFEIAEYLAWPNYLRRARRGWWVTGLLVAEVALGILSLVLWLSHKYFRWSALESLPASTRLSVQYGWLILPGVLLVLPLACLLGRDVFRALYAVEGSARPSEAILAEPAPSSTRGALSDALRWRLTRAGGVAIAFSVAGLLLSLAYFPKLLSHLSPETVVDRYRQLSRSGEPLGMVGMSPTAASYLVGHQVPTFPGDLGAFHWLTAGGRRWLVIRESDLPQLNFRYRDWAAPRANLPVLDGRSSTVLLVSNQRRPGEPDESPFRGWILDRRPRPMHAVDANLEDKLHALGWDILAPDGRPVDSIRAGRSYWLVLYWEVLSPILPAWKTFVHIDGSQRRFNADHDTLQGKYPLHLLLPGDFFADRHEFTVDLTFAPGVYGLYYGMFRDSRRLKVASGRHHEDRIDGGAIRIR